MKKRIYNPTKFHIIICLQEDTRKLIRELSLFITLLFCTIFSVYSQSGIYGKIINADGKPLANANVLLLNSKDSSLVKGQLSNGEGLYKFENIMAGQYIINSTYTGFENEYTAAFTITDKQQSFNLGITKLTETHLQLKEVTIAAKKPLYEQKIDRLVINVAASITFAGGTALDVLERSPGVRVNRMSNALSINGKSGVIIMINGKRNYMNIAAVVQMLAGMPSGNIERIEIITTPPANFDAEGDAGIINIVLKSNEQFGTNGSYSVTAGYSKGEQNSISANMNHREGKVNLFGNYSFSRIRMQQVWDTYHAVTNNGKLLENFSDDKRHALAVQHDGQAGLDYEINKKTIIGALLSASYRHWTMKSLNDALVSSNNRVDTTVSIINNELHTTLYYGVNLNIQHTFSDDEKLTVNADYLHYKDNNPNSYTNAYYDGVNNFLYNENVQSGKTTPLTIWIEAIDYTKKLSKKVDMEAGVKDARSSFKDVVEVSSLFQNNWVKDTFLSGNHTLNENISAAYTSFNIKLSTKISMKAGLRYEYTHSRLETEAQLDIVKRDYGKIFPSFFILDNINDSNSINFSYSRRIWRPGFSDLAPWVLFLDPKTFQTGNPDLQPAIVDAVNTSYTYKNKILSLSYSYISPSITQLPKIDEKNNKLVIASENSKSYQSLSLNLSLPFTINKWWNMQNNLTGNWSKSSSFYKAVVQQEQKNFYINSTQTFLLPKDFSIGLSGFYSSKSLWGLYTFNSNWSADIGLQKKILKNKSILTFNVNNIFNSLKGNYNALIPEQNLIVKNSYTYGYRGFNLSYSHNFGNDKVKEKRDRTTGAEDEKGRGY
jgi:hypothetical protein